MQDPNSKYWRDLNSDKEETGKFDNETKEKYKANRSTYGMLFVFFVILVIIMIAIII